MYASINTFGWLCLEVESCDLKAHIHVGDRICHMVVLVVCWWCMC